MFKKKEAKRGGKNSYESTSEEEDKETRRSSNTTDEKDEEEERQRVHTIDLMDRNSSSEDEKVFKEKNKNTQSTEYSPTKKQNIPTGRKFLYKFKHNPQVMPAIWTQPLCPSVAQRAWSCRSTSLTLAAEKCKQ